MLKVKIAEKAPDFTLKNSNEENISLSDYAGKWVVLYFYPKDNTPGCTTEAKDFTSNLSSFQELNAQILGISGDSCQSHQKFVLKHDLMIPLLSDPSHELLEKYGIWQKKKMMGKEYMGIVRTTLLIDPNGIIKEIWEKVRVKEHVEKVLKRLKELQG